MMPADFLLVKGALEDFWGTLEEPRGTVLRTLHHPLFVNEFGETALVVREGPSPVAYLLGLVSPFQANGYVHLVGVRRDRRRLGLARRLYAEFETLATEKGATSLKAIASPDNQTTTAFHAALGFSVSLVRDYSGPGLDRLVFSRNLVAE
jgi:GNAT superfamily N-acetyltransferase